MPFPAPFTFLPTGEPRGYAYPLTRGSDRPDTTVWTGGFLDDGDAFVVTEGGVSECWYNWRDDEFVEYRTAGHWYAHTRAFGSDDIIGWSRSKASADAFWAAYQAFDQGDARETARIMLGMSAGGAAAAASVGLYGPDSFSFGAAR